MTTAIPPASSDVDDFVSLAMSLDSGVWPTLQGFLVSYYPLVVARAPSVLTVMGAGLAAERDELPAAASPDHGAGRYGSSLHLPLAQATLAAAQRADDRMLAIAQIPADSEQAPHVFVMTMGELQDLADRPYAEVRARFQADPLAARVAGGLIVLQREHGIWMGESWRVLIRSHLPEGGDFGAAAALEAAALQAMVNLLGQPLDGGDLAHVCRVVDREVVGGRCAGAEQLTAALGRKDQLLAVRPPTDPRSARVSDPAETETEGLREVERPSVGPVARSGDRPQREARSGDRPQRDGHPVARSGDRPQRDRRPTAQQTGGSGLAASLAFVPLPPTVRFWGLATDPAPADAAATEASFPGPTGPEDRHPTADCVARFCRVLEGDIDDGALGELGRLLREGHELDSSRGACSAGAGLLVKRLRDAGPARGLYGVRTAGPTGGTVVVLGRTDADAAVREIAASCAAELGRNVDIVSGSSAGACEFGCLRL
jgi:L-arabinokinase